MYRGKALVVHSIVLSCVYFMYFMFIVFYWSRVSGLHTRS